MYSLPGSGFMHESASTMENMTSGYLDANMHPYRVSHVISAVLRITVDGGTDRWLEFIKKHRLGNDLPPPDLITGDLDSVTQASLDHFWRTRRA